ncbi:MAG: CoA-binding protein [Gammaproteobacteria bacterium]|nr:CoA-binding protein [Gammaproteobacteria bacterium]|tara:strand:+ start:7226 stop:7636 length:411 start_codon:yes stop_codon:yes gene_type:complete
MPINYSKSYLKKILSNVNAIALVGASSNPKKDSFKVMKYLIEKGYQVFPVNPNEVNNTILGKRCYSNLNEIEHRIDMVDIFRSKEFVMDICLNAINIGVDVIWTQEGIIDKKSELIATKAGIKFVMDSCPIKILEN